MADRWLRFRSQRRLRAWFRNDSDREVMGKRIETCKSDRRHILAIAGNTEFPGGVTASATIRYMSGLPLTVQNSNIDANMNGVLFDPIAPGTYNGTGEHAITVQNDGGYGGARGPEFLQLDIRFGYRLRPTETRNARPVLRHLQRDEPRQLQQPDGRPAQRELPQPADPAGRKRLPAPGAVRHPVRVLT